MLKLDGLKGANEEIGVDHIALAKAFELNPELRVKVVYKGKYAPPQGIECPLLYTQGGFIIEVDAARNSLRAPLRIRFNDAKSWDEIFVSRSEWKTVQKVIDDRDLEVSFDRANVPDDDWMKDVSERVEKAIGASGIPEKDLKAYEFLTKNVRRGRGTIGVQFNEDCSIERENAYFTYMDIERFLGIELTEKYFTERGVRFGKAGFRFEDWMYVDIDKSAANKIWGEVCTNYGLNKRIWGECDGIFIEITKPGPDRTDFYIKFDLK